MTVKTKPCIYNVSGQFAYFAKANKIHSKLVRTSAHFSEGVEIIFLRVSVTENFHYMRLFLFFLFQKNLKTE